VDGFAVHAVIVIGADVVLDERAANHRRVAVPALAINASAA
jgi:hypothetical protein